MHWYRAAPRFNFSLMTACALARKGRVALTRRHNLQIFLPSASCLPSATPLLAPYLLSLSRSPRAIHQRKSTGVLAFPFFGCSNELAVTSSPSSFHPSTPRFRLPSFRPLFLSWPVNLLLAICERFPRVHTRRYIVVPVRYIARVATPALFDVSG